MSASTEPPDSSTSRAASILSIPQPLRKASFANLARFFGIGGAFANVAHDHDADHDTEQDGEGDEEGGEEADAEEEEVDEESLMWDAQTALIAHQPSLAIQRYTTAALPPHRSAPACLALGNLLTRGTAFASTSPTTPPVDLPSVKGKERERDTRITTQTFSPLVSPISPPAFSRFLHTFFTSGENNQPSAPMTSPPPEKDRKYDLVSNGWAMRKEGKRAVRDVEGMGIAGGWLVLGIGWTVDAELQKSEAKSSASASYHPAVVEVDHQVSMHDDDEMLIMSKGKNPMRLRLPQSSEADIDSASSSTAPSQRPSSDDFTSATHTTDTTESVMLKTPFSENGATERDFEGETKTLKLVYDLLQPLLHLYRHGHIQASDPVFLPPITSTQLPAVLRPAGDMQKRRNAWALGAVVTEKLLQSGMFKATSDFDEAAEKTKVTREWKQLVCGVRNLATYILGMTCDKHLREIHFRSIVTNGPCGLSTADNIVRQAAKRLDIINTPSEPPTPYLSSDGYPFPTMSTLKPPSSKQARRRPSRRQLARQKSALSRATPSPEGLSMASLQPSSSKTSPSPTSPGGGHGYSSSISDSPANRPTALASLRRVSNASLLSNAGKHRRNESCASILSLTSASPATVTVELVAPDLSPSATISSPPRASASDTLRRVRDAADAAKRDISEEDKQWPSLAGWTMARSPPQSIVEAPEPAPSPPPAPVVVDPPNKRLREKLDLAVRPSASSPDIARLRTSPTKHKSNFSALSTPMQSKASSASLLCGDMESIATIDPTLAAAELASALTKHVCCSVCAVKGVNFPECRKCGMRFCSRDCRVGQKGAGDGKRHLCGAWESRKRRSQQEQAGLGLAGMSVPKAGGVPGLPSVAESLGKTPTLASVRAC